MTIKAVRVSKTSLSEWSLYGPVDQALKTTAQADAVRVVPIHLTTHGEPVELELWINAELADEDEPRELNAPALMILQHNEMRRQGITPPQTKKELKEMQANYDTIFDKLPLVKGPAILTGAGCTDMPDELGCILMALVGQHEEDH